MSLIGDVGKELKEDVGEVAVLLGIFIAGLIVMTLGFFWGGFAIVLYAIYRFLPDEGDVVSHAKEAMEEEERLKGTTKKRLRKRAKEFFMEGKGGAALEILDKAGFTAEEVEKILDEWKAERKEKREEAFRI
ncbi:MAG: hypothetical protein ACE5J7_01145 [Candidatus Aenigmatarchaeota archaeon]